MHRFLPESCAVMKAQNETAPREQPVRYIIQRYVEVGDICHIDVVLVHVHVELKPDVKVCRIGGFGRQDCPKR